MECPHFAGVFMKYCAAGREVYVPSIYEMREHCNHLQHKICPNYMRTDNGAASSNASVCHDNARTTA